MRLLLSPLVSEVDLRYMKLNRKLCPEVSDLVPVNSVNFTIDSVLKSLSR